MSKRLAGPLAVLALALLAPVAELHGQSTTLDLTALARRAQPVAGGRTVTELVEGERRGVRVAAAAGETPIWIDGVELETGTIELEVRGKDVLQQSFLGVAFAGVDTATFEAVYLRPFNFRAADPVRKIHAVQYISHPLYPWPRLRAEHAEVFENPVDPVPDPNDWVRLRVTVEPARVTIHVGEGSEPDLVVDRLGDRAGRRVGIWIGNNSDGDFANFRIGR